MIKPEECNLITDAERKIIRDWEAKIDYALKTADWDNRDSYQLYVAGTDAKTLSRLKTLYSSDWRVELTSGVTYMNFTPLRPIPKWQPDWIENAQPAEAAGKQRYKKNEPLPVREYQFDDAK